MAQRAEILIARFEDQINNWLDATAVSRYDSASAIAIHALKRCLAEEKKADSADLKVICLQGRALFNGLRDFADLKRVTTVVEWIETPNAVEFVWDLIFEVRTRIEACAQFLAEDFTSAILADLEAAEDAINKRFGTGWYSSPEVIYRSFLCTICGNDIRGCSHEPGHFYDGEHCEVRPTDPMPICVAMVQRPADPRCRIWPWIPKEKDGEHIVLRGIPIMKEFSLFGDYDGGKPLDLRKFFGHRNQYRRG